MLLSMCVCVCDMDGLCLDRFSLIFQQIQLAIITFNDFKCKQSAVVAGSEEFCERLVLF